MTSRKLAASTTHTRLNNVRAILRGATLAHTELHHLEGVVLQNDSLAGMVAEIDRQIHTLAGSEDETGHIHRLWQQPLIAPDQRKRPAR